MGKKYDFSGWATKVNIKCGDGRTIMKDAFKDDDGQTVPLVWNHQHKEPENVLGHALLENRDDGVYAFCSFNDTEAGQIAKSLVKHGDVSQLSIYANKLKQQGAAVLHGAIREVSLVLAGANPGAYIDSILHGEAEEDDALIYNNEELDLNLNHSDEDPEDDKGGDAGKDETVAEVFETLTEKQKTVVYAMLGQALEDQGVEGEEGTDKLAQSEGGENSMKHNLFDQDEDQVQAGGGKTLSHSDMEAIMSDAESYGSLKKAVMAHGITDVEYLFPDARTMNATPEFIKRDTGWVQKVMSSTHHTPFSRIKSVLANITGEEARARGYIKGKLKKEEVFSLLKRSTTPTTIYKKQKMERDDVIDITDFDVIAFLKIEMRMMLDEEIARAVLIGDGRLSSDDDHINGDNIRPIWTDSDLYSIKQRVIVEANFTDDQKAKAFIRAAVKSRKNYKGSGNPVLFTTEDMLTDCLLMEDTTGRVIYDSVTKLATTLRVSEIITVPVMEGLSRTDVADSAVLDLMGIIVNLNDYNMGADKGGAVNMFDDFDIDYNAQKYLIETRCSGALVKPYSAIVLESTTTVAQG